MTNSIYLLVFLLACFPSRNGKQTGKLESLPFTTQNLAGDYLKVANYYGVPGDSTGSDSSSRNLFNEIAECRKDDIYRYKAYPNQENQLLWGYNEHVCQGQQKHQFVEIGTWLLSDSGNLDISYADYIRRYKLITLTNKQLVIRKMSGVRNGEHIQYEYTCYKRIK